MKYRRTLQEILDSDDELPSDYIEKPYVPAYQDDNRFKYIEELSRKCQENVLEKHSKISSKTQIINKGMLNKKDMLCLQCVQRSIPSDTLLWFFLYMLYKDCQSEYKFLLSCLVPRYENYYSRFTSGPDTAIDKLNCKYKVIIKNGQ